MRLVSLISTSGGAGRSTLVAALADLWRRRGREVLAVDLDPANALALHLGAIAPPAQGWVSAWLEGRPWAQTAQRNSDGVHFLPFGALDAEALARFEADVARDPQRLLGELRRLALADDALVLLDTARLPAPVAQHAARAADLTLAVLHAQAGDYAQLERIEALEAPRLRYVINAFDPVRGLQRDVRLLLREALGARLAPFALHRDLSLADAQARNRALLDDAPHAQLCEDLQLLASWVLRQLDEASA